MFFTVIVWVLYVWILNVSANSGYQMTSIETIRRERQQEKHFLQSLIAFQESLPKLNSIDDHMVVVQPEDKRYIIIP